MLSRRQLLGGLAAGTGLAVAGPALAGGSSPVTAVRPIRRPGSKPFPHLPAGTDMIKQIEHIVVLMMENHSFDCYFGMLGRGDGYRLDRYGRPTASCPDAAGRRVRVYHAPSTCQAHYDVSQSWTASHLSWNHGRNDGFVRATSREAMAYWAGADLPFYYSLARTFPLCDRYFASTMAQTYPNRRFLLAATAWGLVNDPYPSPSDPSPPGGTIFDRLDSYRISWKDYFVDLATCDLFPRVPERSPQRLAPIAEFFADAAAGTLPAFCLVDTEFQHASEENPQDIRAGQYFAWRVIQAVLASPAWEKTVLIYTYDEHGGYYDHVPPPRAIRPDGVPPGDVTTHPVAGTANERPTELYGDLYSYYGFRVPAVIVSPYARRDYVSHVVHDHTSILSLVETKWNLPAMTYRDANASNLLDCLDLTARRPPFADPPALTPAPAPTGVPGCFVQDPTLP